MLWRLASHCRCAFQNKHNACSLQSLAPCGAAGRMLDMLQPLNARSIQRLASEVSEAET